jgi:hypothetical protein
MQDAIVSPEEVTANALVVTEEVDFSALIAKSQKLNQMKEVVQINAEYCEFEKGVVEKGIFAGFVTINIKDAISGDLKPVKAARWVTADKKIKLNGGAALVNELEKAGVPQGTAIQISWNGEKSGNTKVYQISILG